MGWAWARGPLLSVPAHPPAGPPTPRQPGRGREETSLPPSRTRNKGFYASFSDFCIYSSASSQQEPGREVADTSDPPQASAWGSAAVTLKVGKGALPHPSPERSLGISDL